MLSLFLKGFVIGMIIAVPVGPIGLLCVNRTLSKGPLYGLASGFGIATADAISGGVVVLGLTFVSSFLLAEMLWLRLIGGFFLCYLGFKIFLTEPKPRSMIDKENNNLLAAYASTLLLTFSNPLTLLSFVAIYAGWGVEDLSAHRFLAAVLMLGIFCGSASWWVALSGGMPVVRVMFTHDGLRWIHRVSGAIIAAFGFIILLSLTQNFSR